MKPSVGISLSLKYGEMAAYWSAYESNSSVQAASKISISAERGFFVFLFDQPLAVMNRLELAAVHAAIGQLLKEEP